MGAFVGYAARGDAEIGFRGRFFGFILYLKTE